MADNARPTKKQYELLEFIGKFISDHGYGPSYREIMNGCGYTSVATVALHVNNLINKGHLRKKDRSARSLEIVDSSNIPISKSQPDSVEGQLTAKVSKKFADAEASPPTSEVINELEILINALKILGFNDTAQDFQVRLDRIKANSAKL